NLDAPLHGASGGKPMIEEMLEKALAGEDLSDSELNAVMEEIQCGQATPAQMSAFLTALYMKGETKEERAAIKEVKLQLGLHKGGMPHSAANPIDAASPESCSPLTVAMMAIGAGDD